jgi:hypothetical protein
MIGPGLAEVDMSLFKTTRLTERWGLQFRAEFFNLLNRTNFGTPAITVWTAPTTQRPQGAPAPGAGKITRTATTSRQLQFGLKLSF